MKYKSLVTVLALMSISTGAVAGDVWAAKCGKEKVIWEIIGNSNKITVGSVEFPVSAGTKRFVTDSGEIVTGQFAAIDVNHQVAVVFTNNEIKNNKFNLVGWGKNVIPCKVTQFNTW